MIIFYTPLPVKNNLQIGISSLIAENFVEEKISKL
jgi:hypothetical protein